VRGGLLDEIPRNALRPPSAPFASVPRASSGSFASSYCAIVAADPFALASSAVAEVVVLDVAQKAMRSHRKSGVFAFLRP